MNTHRKLKAGDIVTIGKSPLLHLVVRSERVISRDYNRGDEYWVDEMDAVSFSEKQMVRRPYQGATFNNDLKHFHFEGGCMAGSGKRIKPEDVKIQGASKVHRHEVVTYTMDPPEFFDGR